MPADPETKKLVLLRLESWPPDVKISFGSGEELTRDQLIERVKAEDDLGKEILSMQMKYLRSLKAGIFHA